MLAIACVALLPNLGDQLLWQDEAQTALIAGTVLTHGVPMGFDGTNSFSQDRGQDHAPGGIWLWHPWLPFYVLAGFFAAFGKSTLVARLPFALFGVATVVLAAVFARSLWRSRRAGLIAAAVLAIDVPFLVLARQCRYYAPGMFFALLALCGYVGMLERRGRSSLLFAGAALALFHTHYVHYGALVAAVIAHAVLFRRDRLRSVLLAAGATALVSVPWIVWFATMSRVVAQYASVGRAATFARIYLDKMFHWVFPTALIVAAALAWGLGRFGRRHGSPPSPSRQSHLALLLLFVSAAVAAASVTSTYPFVRFIAPVVPVCALIAALALDGLAGAHRVAGPVLVAVVLVALGRGWSATEYLHEITHHYRGPVDGIVEHLRKNARKTDVVAITYDDLPVKFYTGLRVVGGLTGEDLTPARTADWVVIRRNVISRKDREVREYLAANVPLRQYVAHTLDAPDIPFQNREEPGEHLFRTATADPVVIFERSEAIPNHEETDRNLERARSAVSDPR